MNISSIRKNTKYFVPVQQESTVQYKIQYKWSQVVMVWSRSWSGGHRHSDRVLIESTTLMNKTHKTQQEPHRATHEIEPQHPQQLQIISHQQIPSGEYGSEEAR